jgi:hypothetical protein
VGRLLKHIGGAQVAWDPGFQCWSREPKAAETYLGNWGLVVVLTASALSKVLSARSFLERTDDSFWLCQDRDGGKAQSWCLGRGGF